MTDKLKKAIDGVKCFLLDLDGTVYLEGELIGDMADTLNAIRKSGRRIVYLTNNSSRSRDVYVRRLTDMGIYDEKDTVFTSGMSTLSYLNREHKANSVYLMGTEALRREFIMGGIKLVDDEPDVVVVSYDTEINYEKITKVTHFLSKGAKYITTHGDMLCPAKINYLPDVGTYINMFESATGRRPEVNCGKPYEVMGEAIMEILGLQPHEIIMCGDRLSTDIAFGVNNGFWSLLVWSGETDKNMYKKSEVKASFTLDDLNCIREYL